MTDEEKRAASHVHRVRAILEGIRSEAETSRFDTAAAARRALERIRAMSVVGLALVPEVLP